MLPDAPDAETFLTYNFSMVHILLKEYSNIIYILYIQKLFNYDKIRL